MSIPSIFAWNVRFQMMPFHLILVLVYTGELGYDSLNGTRKIGPSYAKSVVYI